MKQFLFTFCAFLMAGYATANGDPVKTDLLSGTPQYVRYGQTPNAFRLAAEGKAAALCVSSRDWEGVICAAGDLAHDIHEVSGATPRLLRSDSPVPGSVVIGTIGHSPLIDKMVEEGRLDVSAVKGKWESFLIQTVDGSLVVAGSDKRGTIYAIYDISEKIGVSPWYW